jgi:2'-5' RNA ligase
VPRLRLGVALLVPAPQSHAVDALRRAVGDPALGRIPAHLTLVPPVNVREERLDDALAVLRAAAASAAAFTVRLGPPATFLPANPVLYLPVTSGEPAIERLRDAVFRGPLARPLTWPFVPHVTVADEAEPSRIEAAVRALAGFHLEFEVRGVHLLQEGRDRHWQPIADADLGPPAVIGRGGLELELTRSEQPDPGAARTLGRPPFCITARRDGRPVGMIAGHFAADVAGDVTGDVAVVERLVVAEAARGQGIGSHLAAAAEALAAERGCASLTVDTDPAGRLRAWLEGRGWSVETTVQTTRLRRRLR